MEGNVGNAMLPELLAYWPSQLKVLANDWAGHPANLGRTRMLAELWLTFACSK